MKEIHQLENLLDALMHDACALKFSTETTLAWRSLQMAKGWLGLSVASSEVRMTDVRDESLDTNDKFAGINFMRERIKNAIVAVESKKPDEEWQASCFDLSLCNLHEARMWYDYAMREMRVSNAVEVALPDVMPGENVAPMRELIFEDEKEPPHFDEPKLDENKPKKSRKGKKN